MTKSISDYATAHEYADSYGKVPLLEKKGEELRTYIKELEHEIYTEMRLLNERWHGYKILQESSYEAENKTWYESDDDEYRKITGECIELWHSSSRDNAEFLKKAAIDHARKLVIAEDKKVQADKDSKDNWDKQWNLKKKAREEWNNYQEENSEKEAA